MACPFSPSWLSTALVFVVIGLASRTAEFSIHEALHYRMGASAASNAKAMLVSDVLLHIASPIYRAGHIQEHHVFTNSRLSEARDSFGGADTDLDDLVAIFRGKWAIIAFPLLRVAVNAPLWWYAPRVYVAVKLACHAYYTLANTVGSGWRETWFNVAACFTRVAATMLCGLASRRGGWSAADVILLSSLARSSMGTYSFLLPSLMSHLSMKTIRNKDPGEDHVLRQLLMSTDFLARSQAATYFFNAINVQTMHHLFPQLPWQHLSALTPLIEASAKKNDQVYSEWPSYTSAMLSTCEAVEAIPGETIPDGKWDIFAAHVMMDVWTYSFM